MNNGTRDCYRQGIIRHNDRWWCKRCYAKVAQRAALPTPSTKSELSDQELLELSNKDRQQELYNNKIALYRKFNQLLREILELRGISPKTNK